MRIRGHKICQGFLQKKIAARRELHHKGELRSCECLVDAYLTEVDEQAKNPKPASYSFTGTTFISFQYYKISLFHFKDGI